MCPHIQLSSRIIGGAIDVQSKFPWHAKLEVTLSANPTTFHCGGSIISNQFVLTSAGCVANALSIAIKMGSTYSESPAQLQRSSTYFVHPSYNSLKFQNNIALIKLPVSLNFTFNLHPIQLVSRSQANDMFIGRQTWLSGYGVTANSKFFRRNFFFK